jgi:hypothetical protein
MTAALKQNIDREPAPRSEPATLHHFIAGERVHGTGTRFDDVFNPATGEVRARVPLAARWPGSGPSEAQFSMPILS